jgi:Tol biopolymer transport system component
MRTTFVFLAVFLAFQGWIQPSATHGQDAFVTGIRQITFEGRRSGEGYFSADGTKMVFQSERDPANPFYQIFWTDLETGDIVRVSPGHGKTTCAWIHPDGNRVMFASTQHDPESLQKQKAALDLRSSGKEPRYAWDYDPNYEIYEADLATKQFKKLTDAKGYDAEGCYSPDGSLIVFASNRQAYERELTEREQKLFEVDQSFMMEIYVMNADGSNVRRLTTEPGYDGGPFFSPDGKRICFRRFDENGLVAEIYTMNVDGSDVKRLTNIGKTSWAPFYHPTGEYLVFTTNLHGFGNFELYLVRADGQGEPVRVTNTDGFDGLASFLPDGNQIAWTSNRDEANQSQIYMAQWDHQAARKALGITDSTTDSSLATAEDQQQGSRAAQETDADYSPTDLMRHVDYLTRKELGGRLTGTEGERRATAYVAAYLESLGFVPAGENGTFFQNFEFPAGSSINGENSLKIGDTQYTLDKDFRPLSFSDNGTIDASEIAFAGYGMQVPASADSKKKDSLLGDEYDSYVHLNVEGRYVMVLRDLPQDLTPEQRQRMARYSTPQRKAIIARDLGAKGILFVSGPTSQVKNQLIRFSSDESQASVSIAALSITNEIAEKILADSGQKLGELQKSLDDGSLQMGFMIEKQNVSATVNIERKRGIGRNVVARYPMAGGDDPSKIAFPVVMVGAHIDHLGLGGGGNSLARDDEQDQIHFGADDNASGVGAMLEIAQSLVAQAKSGKLSAKRDLIVAAWSGEELGLFGSQAFVQKFHELYPDAPRATIDPEQARIAAAHGVSPDAAPLTTSIAAYFNLDMVGRMRDSLIVQGIGSSPSFEAEVRRRNVPVGLELSLDRTSTRLPTDASAFVARDVPILAAFTGAHEDYHTPRDTADKLNYEGASKIAKLGGLIVRGWLSDDKVPEFKLDEGDNDQQDAPLSRSTATLGTIPDYVPAKVKGLKLSGVAKGGPAEKAGIRGGDIVVKLASKTIEGIYDYTYAIEALKIGQEVEIVVLRGDKTVPLRITPESRE